MAGEYSDCCKLEELYRNHSHITKHCTYRITDYKTASLIKYSINAYLATKVVFMNQMYQLYHDVHGSAPDTMHSSGWHKFSDILSADVRIGNSHLNVPGPDKNYGYGGSCFPKDVKALIGFDQNKRLSVIREAEEANTKIRLIGKKNY
jgi:UDPglucose 6-dehydrogenase